MILVAGLGNPGKKYTNTKHNIGFLVVDEIGKRVGIELKKNKFKGIFGEGFTGDIKLALLKPETYMNLSGESVSSIKNFYDIPTENIIVVYDEMDLPLGDIRIKSGGGSAGHNGIKSIISSLGSGEFTRVRVGIGKPLAKDSGAGHVLSGFSKDEGKIVKESIMRAADAVFAITEDGLERAMNKYNTKNKQLREQ
jgi:peptidyl-tRNA hydrolase, PTH1 family